jgi:Trk K+ transport system NAD-binding subunit
MNVLLAGDGLLAGAIGRALAGRGAQVARLAADDPEAIGKAQLDGIGALVLAADDDSGNIDLALRARALRSDLPIVARIFDAGLAGYMKDTVPDVTVLSMSGIAAPVIAAAAHKALAERPPQAESLESIVAARRRFRVDRVLLAALASLFVLVFPSALYFSYALNLRYLDALYFVWTTVMTVGYGDISLKDASDGAKLFGMGLMLAGAAFIAVLFALLSDWVMSRRFDMLRGHTRERGSGHIVIAGAGNVGFRVAGLLGSGGRRLVIVDREPDSRNVAALNLAGHHVIVGDAGAEEMLLLAGLPRAALVLALTDSDAVNLRIALLARGGRVPAILRVVSPELSAHVTARGDGIAFSPVAAAAEAFAAAALAATERSLQ